MKNYCCSKQPGRGRTVLRDFISAVASEYHTTACINAELILCALSNMNLADKKCFLAQFHKGISCLEEDFEAFEDECAQGIISVIKINHSTPVELLPGFTAFSSSQKPPVFLIRLTTALTDYMAYSSNADLQKCYSSARGRWDNIRLKPGSKGDQFDILEEEAWSQLVVSAAAAHRAVPDHLDRGLLLLKSFPAGTKTLIDKYARKSNTPENMMTRDWVIACLKRIDRELSPQFSWGNNPNNNNQPCSKFANGTCTYGANCKF